MLCFTAFSTEFVPRPVFCTRTVLWMCTVFVSWIDCCWFIGMIKNNTMIVCAGKTSWFLTVPCFHGNVFLMIWTGARKRSCSDILINQHAGFQCANWDHFNTTENVLKISCKEFHIHWRIERVCLYLQMFYTVHYSEDIKHPQHYNTEK